MISVVIPLYNKQAYVARALQSVIAQTYTDFEVLVVDDGSTDDSVKVVNEFADKRIRLIQQNNQGVSAARNRGISESHYESVAFLDADDKWEPTFLQTVVTLSERYPSCGVMASAYKHIDSNGKVKEIHLSHLPFQGIEGMLTNYFEVATHSNPPIWSSCVFVRKELLHKIGGFPVGIKQGEDLLTWARLAVLTPIAYSVEPLATFYPERESYYSKPSRVPDVEDRVGKKLELLLRNYPNTKGLSSYIGHWHKMRASIYLRLPNHRADAFRETLKSLRRNPKTKNLYLYLPLLLLPYSIRMRCFSHLQ